MLRVFVLSVAMVGAALAATPVHAQSDARTQEAKQHFETGMAHYQLEEWDQAIDEWEKGFVAKPVPQFLYNIAQAYRQSKRPDKALSFYQKYLRMDPRAKNRGEVERHIATLKKLLAEQQRAASRPPVQPLPDDELKSSPGDALPPPDKQAMAKAVKPQAAPPPAEPAASAAPATARTAQLELPKSSPPAAGLVATAAPPKHTPVYKKGWFWGVIGGGVAVAVGVTIVAVLVAGNRAAHTLPAVHF